MENQEYNRRFAYFDSDNLDRVQTENGGITGGIFCLLKKNGNNMMFTREDARLILPLLEHFAENGNIQTKDEIQEQQLENISGYQKYF